ncbi:MAG: lanthionine synthetase LanC family protein [Egibacteraceae bacterium]
MTADRAAAPGNDVPARSETDPWLLESVRSALKGKAHEWRVSSAVDAKRPWIVAEPEGGTLPAQGWKLHVASYGSRAAETLRRVLPRIIEKDIAFKVIGSVSWLRQLNRGSAGLSQIGKFITVYPGDDSQAVDIAIALGDATRGLRGPEIPSDRPIEPGSVVHYRYGAFGDLLMQTRLGEITPALVVPGGRLAPDRRGAAPWQPSWVQDPFVACGLGAPSRLASRVGGRYQPVLTLSQSPGVLVQLALDVVSPRTCVLKRARLRDHGSVPYDDPGSRLRREKDLLADLADLGSTPRLYDVCDDGDELALIIEDLGSETLEQHVRALAARGIFLPHSRVVEIGVALADAAVALHDRGYVHGDLKSTNVIVGPDGRLRLLDLDLAHLIGSGDRRPGAGTRGYTSADCRAGARVAPTDDIHAIGALLYFMTTGAEPSRAPAIENLLSRPPEVLNPAIDPSLLAIIERCLSDDPDRRFASVRDVTSALLSGGEAGTGVGWTHVARVSGVTSEEALRQARRAADHICAQAEPGDHGLVWRSTHYLGKGLVGRDVSSGTAGIVLALAELVGEFQDPAHADVLRRGASALAVFPPLAGDRPSGLYVGDAGVAAALLRAGQVLDDTGFIDAAIRKGRSAANRPVDSPDLFHGAAGRLLVLLLLWDETGDPQILDRAVRIGDELLDLREGEPGEARWRIPAGYADLSGRCYLGYAHGAAGIADTLLDLFDVTGEQRYAEAALDAISWIARQAVPTLDDVSGLGWPQVENGRLHPPFWCHGATGIGRLLLHAARRGVSSDAPDLLMRTCRSVANGARWSGPTLCHGLTGNVELLLDVAQWTGQRHFLDAADRLMLLANAFVVASDDGCAWISEAPRQITPDYLIGYGGVAITYLRRGVQDRPHQLSRAGFRYRSLTRAASPATSKLSSVTGS